MTEQSSVPNMEIEIKVRLTDRATFEARLPSLGFKLRTAGTMERNVLYDTSGGELRSRRQLLRVRHYGDRWVLTHKAPAPNGSDTRHKQRIETETEVSDGAALTGILERLGYQPVFTYEKQRAEWSDEEGHVVVDVTPIGDFAELEGSAEWIDRTAAALGISPDNYLTASYGQLFSDWKAASKSSAANMTFADVDSR